MKNYVHIDYLKNLADLLPNKPGIYQFFSNEGEMIYVGKAKDLKKRVSTYFTKKTHESKKIDVLVSKVTDLKHFVVETESDAFLLENNLIKSHQPRYNVLLKDDKTFPWICIKNEPFPRVFITRNIVNDGSQYFGPYTSVVMVRTLLTLVKQLFKLRTCSYGLTIENITNKKFKVCLEYHIGNCRAPCVGHQNTEDYETSIQQVRNILKGNITQVLHYLKDTMMLYASEYRYEEAKIIKEKIELLERYKNKSTIVNPSINNIDVFSYLEEDDSACVNYLKVIDGAIIQAHTLELKKRLNESKEELLLMAIVDIRNRLSTDSPEIIVPFYPDAELGNVRFIVPKIGDKKKLLDLSERNAKFYLLEKQKQKSERSYKQRTQRILGIMMKDLKLSAIPDHIECFDNSNLQGTNPVAACVVFKEAKPSKKDYRHYNIKTVSGPDDFLSIKEIILRRYKRLLNEGTILPKLIIIDGGKGQLNAANESLEILKLRGKIPIIGIAKRLEEIYFPEDPIPLYLDKNSESLKLIQQIRDEAHRFGIEFHRLKRSRSFIRSELEEIPGLGVKTIDKLFKSLKTLNKIKSSSLEELENIIGKSKSSILNKYFRP